MARLVRIPEGFGWLEGGTVHLAAGTFATGFQRTGQTLPLQPDRLLAPVDRPSKIVALASSYPKHAAEMGRSVPDEPRLFLKAPSAIIDPGVAIALPDESDRVDPEGELALIMGVGGAIFGYTCLNDVTCRDFQKVDRIFGRAKSYDTFCPIGPWIETQLDHPDDVGIETRVNGERRAGGRSSDLHWPLADILSFIQRVMTLNPGDVVTTGTPPGVNPIHPGDVVEVEVEGIGVLRNPVVARK